LALWRGAEPEKSEQLDKFLSECMPSVKHALVKPAPKPSFQRLWIQQADKELFDARHISDGALFFIGLAMQIIAVEEGSTVFIEEPEQSIHPRKLSDIVNLLRRVVEERGCQFVIATHSPVLLNEFRDEPEAIVLFCRGENGTRVKPLSGIPELKDALAKSDPGAMFADGFFNHPF
jgi:predicted ATPase